MKFQRLHRFVKPIGVFSTYLLVALLGSCSSGNVWLVEEISRQSEGETSKTAIFSNRTGHSLRVARDASSNSVWLTFSLPDFSSDQLSMRTNASFRVDEFDSRSFKGHRFIKTHKADSTTISRIIWHGKTEEGLSDTLIRIMDGKQLVVTYYLTDEKHRSTLFSLVGAKSALADALDINPEINYVRQAELRSFKTTFIEKLQVCNKYRQPRAAECATLVEQCANQASGKVGKFNNCIKHKDEKVEISL